MSAKLLFDSSNFKVLIRDLEAGFHLFQSLGRDGINSEFSLALSKAEPQFAPGRVPSPLAKEPAHLRAAIAARQGRLVGIILRSHFCCINGDV